MGGDGDVGNIAQCRNPARGSGLGSWVSSPLQQKQMSMTQKVGNRVCGVGGHCVLYFVHEKCVGKS